MIRAECLTGLNRADEALDAYQESLSAQRAFPNAGTDAYLGFGELVLVLHRADLYRKALDALEEFGVHMPFPIQQYRAAAISARISEARGDLVAARKFAKTALAAASKTESPFRYHRDLGLVGTLEPEIEARLRRLASALLAPTMVSLHPRRRCRAASRRQ
jgi:hypothetical protein